jgi:hypothetical protein
MSTKVQYDKPATLPDPDAEKELLVVDTVESQFK